MRSMERRRAARLPRWQTHSSEKRKARETRATRARAAMATPPRPLANAGTQSLHDALRKRHGEQARLADALRQLAKARGGDELIELLLRPPAHDPRSAV